MGLTAVPPGHLACIVTSLERDVPRLSELDAVPVASPGGLTLAPWRGVDLARYRRLYRAVGTPWLWFSRLLLDDAQLDAILANVNVHIWSAVDDRDVDRGLIELDLRVPGEVELSFFGLVPEATGRGDGRWLMDQMLRLVAATARRRLWVHSCTLDHPRAMAAYERAEFQAFARAVEVFADPRLIGVLPRDAAPQVAMLG